MKKYKKFFESKKKQHKKRNLSHNKQANTHKESHNNEYEQISLFVRDIFLNVFIYFVITTNVI